MRSQTRRAVVVAWAAVVWGGCASRPITSPGDLAVPTQLTFPPCDLARSPVTLELLKVSPDYTPRKPAADVRHVLVDLRVQSRMGQGLWLLVNEETFPPTVYDFSKTPEGEWS